MPNRVDWNDDLSRMSKMGANAIRVYHTPPVEFLNDALVHGIRVLIDVPWEKHRCFLEDWESQQEAK